MPEIANIGVATAFAAGVISFLSPCVLPLVPGYVSYVAGRSVDRTRSDEGGRLRLSTLGPSAVFVLGFSTVFVALGAGATAIGRLLLQYRYEANILGGLVVIAFGLFMIGLFRPHWLLRELRFHAALPGGRALAAYVLGLTFAFGWTPCIGPVLGAILTVSTVSSTVSSGVVLLGIYSLGLGLPFLAAAVFADGLASRLQAMRRAGAVLQLGAGAILVAMGAAMITGRLSALSYWLLDAFPVLGRIG